MKRTLTKRLLRLAVITMLTLALLPSVASAVVFNLTFDGLPLGGYFIGDWPGSADPAKLESWSAAGGMDKGTNVYGQQNAQPSVVGVGGGFATGQHLSTYRHYGDGGPLILANLPSPQAFTGTTSGQWAFSFDIALPTDTVPPNGPVGPDFAGFRHMPGISLLSNLGTHNWASKGGTLNGGALLTVETDGSTGSIYLVGAAGNTTLVPNAAANTVYHVETLIDMTTHTFSITLDGVPMGSGLSLLQTTAGEGIMGMGIEQGDSPNGQYTWGDSAAYDNILLQQVPEPAALSLLALGGLALLRRRRAFHSVA